MLRALRVVVLGALCASAGCQSPNAYEVSRREDEGLRSKAERLLLLVSVETPAPPSPVSGESGASELARAEATTRRYLSPDEILSVSLSVDGRSLGTFETQGRDREQPPKDGTSLRASGETALVIADLGKQADVPSLRTLGDWVDAFQRSVASGTHVLEVTGATLREAGQPRFLSARSYLPFSVPDGASSAYVGHAELVMTRPAP